MKKSLYVTGVLVGILVLTHFFLYFWNRELYQTHLKQRREFKPTEIQKFSDFRIKYESQQQDNLKGYRRIEKRSEYVQIPIERAFDYYLRTHPKL